jgi:uncharacterized membrane protein YeiH
MITGCAGGIMRDILCSGIPLILRKEIYASASLLTGAVYLIIQHFLGNEFYYAPLISFLPALR